MEKVFVLVVIGVVVYLIYKRKKSNSSSQAHNSTSYRTTSTLPTSSPSVVTPYPMQWSNPNEVIGAIDKSAEFIWYAKSVVLQDKIATGVIHPGSAFIYATCNLQERKMKAGFSYKTDYCAFREEIKHGLKGFPGWSVDDGFWFNEDSGMISYCWETELSEVALDYFHRMSKEEITEQMQRIVTNNAAELYTSCKIRYEPQIICDIQITLD